MCIYTFREREAPGGRGSSQSSHADPKALRADGVSERYVTRRSFARASAREQTYLFGALRRARSRCSVRESQAFDEISDRRLHRLVLLRPIISGRYCRGVSPVRRAISSLRRRNCRRAPQLPDTRWPSTTISPR